MPTIRLKLLLTFRYMQIGLMLYLFWTTAYSQNLVPNHDFNFFSECPDGRGLIHFAAPWYSPNYITTDFSHRCAEIGSISSIPTNWWGHQEPYSGNGYAGIRTWLDRDNSLTGVNYREYLAVELTDSLKAGATYLLSFKVSVGDNVGFFSDDIGMYLSRDSIPETVVIRVTPQLSNPEGNFLRDMGNWVEISGNYVAEGGEKFIVIGNFRDDDETTIIERDGNSITTYLQTTYFYIDDVRVEECTKYFPKELISASDTIICPGEETTLSVPPLQDAIYTWDDGTSGMTREVNTAQTYSIEIEIEGCIRRDTLDILSKGIPQLDLGADTTLCPRESLTLTYEGEADNWQWNDQTTNATLTITSPGLYTLQVVKNDCVVSDSIYIYYEDELPMIPPLEALKCDNESMTLEAANGGIEYLWQDLSSDTIFIAQNAGIYWVDIISNCVVRRQSFYINEEKCSCDSFVPNVFSPNADGINDTFIPKLSEGGISTYQLTVFDRFGRLMFSTRDIATPWQGNFQQKNAPEGVYYWILRFDCKEGGVQKEQIFKGHVSLLR